MKKELPIATYISNDKLLRKREYNRRKTEVYPNHPLVNNWMFTEDTEDEAALEEK